MARVYYIERKRPVALTRSARQNTDAIVGQLQAFVRGVLADGVVNEAEARAFHSQLVEKTDKFESLQPPLDDLVRRVAFFASDDDWSPDELDELQSLLNAFVEHRHSETPPLESASHFFDDPQPTIEYVGNEFVLSGQFAYGRKNLIVETIEAKGGVVHSNVRKSTNYVVVGSFVSEGWAHGDYGLKIEAAIRARAASQNIAIISEDHWRMSV